MFLPMSSESAAMVTVEIVLTRDMDSFANATVRVSLEDVSLLDAPSKTIAQQVMHNISHQNGAERRLIFILYGDEPIDERANYSISAHVDLQGNGQINQGDYITMQSYPVLTFGNSDKVLIRVKRIN